MDKRPELAFATSKGILQFHSGSDVPTISRIRKRQRSFCVAQGLTEQRLVQGITADNSIQCHDISRRNGGAHFDEVAARELDVPDPSASRRLAGCRRGITAGRLDDDRACHASVEQLERECADARANVQQRTVDDTCLSEALEQEAGRWCRPLSPITL